MNIKALHATPRAPREADAPAGPDDWRPPPRRRWGLWVGAFFLLMLVGLAVGYRLWGRSVRARLDATLAELRREGEPISPEDLVRPGVPADDNAVFDLRAAATLIDTTSVAWKNYQSVSLDNLPADDAKAAVARVLEPVESRQALARVRTARGKRSADWQVPMRAPLVSMLLPDLNPQRNVSELCRAAAADARSRNDHGAALEYARDMLGVSRALQNYPALVSHLTMMGICASGVAQVEAALPGLHVAGASGSTVDGTSAAGEKPATPGQLRALIADLLDESDFQQSLIQALRDERAMELDTALAVADGRLSSNAVFGAGGPIGPAGLMPKPLILGDATILVDFNTATIKAVRRASDYPAFRANAPPDPFGPAGGQPLRGHALARVLLPAYDRAILTHYRTLAERRLAAAAVAVKGYQADHGGKAPATLEELVPTYLPALPADPFAPGGKPLRYAANGKRVLVYSVNENGADDGGSDELMRGRRNRQSRWEHLDAVWWLGGKPDGGPGASAPENGGGPSN